MMNGKDLDVNEAKSEFKRGTNELMTKCVQGMECVQQTRERKSETASLSLEKLVYDLQSNSKKSLHFD